MDKSLDLEAVVQLQFVKIVIKIITRNLERHHPLPVIADPNVKNLSMCLSLRITAAKVEISLKEETVAI